MVGWHDYTGPDRYPRDPFQPVEGDIVIPCATMPGPADVAFLTFWAFTQAASPPSWPASAGAPLQLTRSEFRDPRPDYFDPPAGMYRWSDCKIRWADPPPGYYDPPAGQYLVVPVEGPDAVLGPLPTAEASAPAWLLKQRRLRIGLGVSLGAAAVGLLVGLVGEATDGLSLTKQPTNADPPSDGDEFLPSTVIAAFLVPAGLITAIVLGINLGVHNRRRLPSRRLQVSGGGFRLSF
jgi:hypothetical protein